MANEDIVFQISSWDYYHEEVEEVKKYVIRLFGRTKDDQSVYVKVNGYTPYFYVEIPKKWRNNMIDLLIKTAKEKVWPAENKESLINYKIVEKHKFWGFTNYKKFNFVQLIFDSWDGLRSYERVFNKHLLIKQLSPRPTKYKLYESNIEPILRCMHIRKLDACGWVQIPNGSYTILEDNEKPTHNDINISTKWTSLNRIEDKSILPFIIASYDIECTSEDGSFPKSDRAGDKITQIGTTFSKFGENDVYHQHLITLGSCDDIEGATVESYETEGEVLMAWVRLIKKMNPDIVTGWNIFGFDYQYLHDRSIFLGIQKKFSKLSRLTDESSKFEIKELASSALGKNILKYYNMTGRVQFDLMKVVQRDFKLSSYKLDYVASYFIREVIEKLEITKKTTTIHTKSTFGVKVGQYITINFDDGIIEDKYMDGQKFQIEELTNKTITVGTVIDTSIMDKGYKVFWCQAKDDVSPAEIFALQKKGPAERSKIGRYCLMDCVLVSKLVAKLQVLTNNIGMANVCHVPLSYLFFRGQGIKIFSLVSRKCREKNHLMPVLKKKFKNNNKDDNKKNDIKLDRLVSDLNKNKNDVLEDDSDDEGFEGATVFDPIKGVHFDPIPVLDYGSLYPSSMIHKNLSHECLVMDKEYDNLEGYKYHQITYNNNDGTTTTCRFAQKLDDTPGIIPEILSDLLSARSRTKDEMENEKDAFLKSILDGLQAAYKVTANSLYGQTGSSVSSIYMKDIAACTTSTGREMLLYSKNFIEIIFNIMISLALGQKVDIKKIIKKINTDLQDEEKKKTYSEMFISELLPKLQKMVDKDITYEEYALIIMKNVPDKKFKSKDKPWQTKEEYIKNFKEVMNKILLNKKVSPEVIYGDSVTGDTPILLRKKINDKYEIVIKTIDTIGNLWKPYEQFKNDQAGLSEKQHDDNIEYEVWSDKGWSNIERVIKHKTNKKIYEVLTDIGCVRITEDHSLLTDKGVQIKPTDCTIFKTALLHAFPEINNSEQDLVGIIQAREYGFSFGSASRSDQDKIIPSCILNGSEKEKTAFLEGYCTANGTNRFDTKSQISAMNMYYLVRSLRYNVSINKREEMFIVTYNNQIYRKEECVIKKIKEIGKFNDYVYDLETETGHFHAGVGQLIVKNTDSVFFRCGIVDLETGKKLKDKQALEIAIQLGLYASHTICLILPSVQKQSYEKTLWPFAIITKKRYVGNLYEQNPNKYKQKSMGIVLKRRDNAPIVKIVCGGIIDQILNKQSAKGAIEFTRKALKKILSGKYPIEKFIITKTLKYVKSDNTEETDKIKEEEDEKQMKKDKKEFSFKPIKMDVEEKVEKVDKRTKDPNKPTNDYADRTRIVHAVLADRMAERDPGNKPLSNDRIPYVYIETDKPVDLQGDRVEHPEYVIANNLKIDYLFYITNQIMKPAIQFLELLVENPNQIFEEYILREENRRKNMKPINYYIGGEKGKGKEMNDLDVQMDGVAEVFQAKEKEKKKNVKKNKIKTPKVKMESPKFNKNKNGFEL
ncbi:MAG: DNA polymerase family B elongation subunit [Edafosvirus sp.]|uniref:DNA-directed DNA polymerase n=1 Tax=Edafosvirus sp. TaxID=2487765 RepID=A0A3G4ZU64_9VIRU|nr:MAG: DNA polymerase family B elongation subunit [Edafosvirus sp.]